MGENLCVRLCLIRRMIAQILLNTASIIFAQEPRIFQPSINGRTKNIQPRTPPKAPQTHFRNHWINCPLLVFGVAWFFSLHRGSVSRRLDTIYVLRNPTTAPSPRQGRMGNRQSKGVFPIFLIFHFLPCPHSFKKSTNIQPTCSPDCCHRLVAL